MKPTRKQIEMMIKGIPKLLWFTFDNLSGSIEGRTAICCDRSYARFRTFAAKPKAPKAVLSRCPLIEATSSCCGDCLPTPSAWTMRLECSRII
jgi:hypothetical protein